jgi:hypothetical protein
MSTTMPTVDTENLTLWLLCLGYQMLSKPLLVIWQFYWWEWKHQTTYRQRRIISVIYHTVWCFRETYCVINLLYRERDGKTFFCNGAMYI